MSMARVYSWKDPIWRVSQAMGALTGKYVTITDIIGEKTKNKKVILTRVGFEPTR